MHLTTNNIDTLLRISIVYYNFTSKYVDILCNLDKNNASKAVLLIELAKSGKSTPNQETSSKYYYINAQSNYTG